MLPEVKISPPPTVEVDVPTAPNPKTETASIPGAKVDTSPSFKIQNTQSNAIILPNLADLEKKILLQDEENAKILAEKKKIEAKGIVVVLDPKMVQQYLADYAILLKEQAKNVLGSLVASVQFSIKDQAVQMLVDSKIKAQQLIGIKEDLREHLRKHLKEESVELKIGFVEGTAETKPTKAYSPKERLQEMMDDNPAVKDLIEKLDLNFEY